MSYLLFADHSKRLLCMASAALGIIELHATNDSVTTMEVWGCSTIPQNVKS